MTVSLSPEEMFFAAQVGVRRRIRAILKARANYHAYNGANNWTIDIDAALAELAVAKALGIYWPAQTNPDYEGDVGPGIHVRSTHHSEGSLILYPSDPDGDFFYLAIGREQSWSLPGRIIAGAGKNKEFWRTNVRSPAFFVPQSQLTPI